MKSGGSGGSGGGVGSKNATRVGWATNGVLVGYWASRVQQLTAIWHWRGFQICLVSISDPGKLPILQDLPGFVGVWKELTRDNEPPTQHIGNKGLLR